MLKLFMYVYHNSQVERFISKWRSKTIFTYYTEPDLSDPSLKFDVMNT